MEAGKRVSVGMEITRNGQTISHEMSAQTMKVWPDGRVKLILMDPDAFNNPSMRFVIKANTIYNIEGGFWSTYYYGR